MVSPLELAWLGISSLQDPFLWVLVFGGVLIGIIFGVIPGVHGTVAIILLLPFTYFMPIDQSLILLASTYCGGVFGGAISAILVNIPGTPEAVCTTFDGYPMAQKGQAGKALGAAITVSSLGGVFGKMIFLVAAPFIAGIALQFGSADYFGLIVMGLLVIGVISGKSLAKGLLSGAIGILIGTVGFATQSAQLRFAFGSTSLSAGFEFIAVMIGAFAIGQILAEFSGILAGKKGATIGEYRGTSFSLRELWAEKFNFIRSAILGNLMGFVPGLGATLASFVGYGAAKGMSKKSEEFGTGKLSGVIAPESANNAATGGAMIPLLTLGIPGGTATAVMLAVFLLKGVQVGPMIFHRQPELVGAIVITMMLANLFMFLIARQGMPLFARVLKANYAYLVSIGGIFCFIGAFALRTLLFDTLCALVVGIISYYWAKSNFPRAPFILGVVLGPMAEFRYVMGMAQHNQSITGVLTSPIGMAFLIVGLGFMLPPIISAAKGLYRDMVKKSSSEEVLPSINMVTPFVYLVLVGICLYLWYLTATWIEVEGKVGPAAWPRMALAAIIILSAIMIIKWILNYVKVRKRHTNNQIPGFRSFIIPDGIYSVVPMVLFAGYFLLQNILGFVFSSLVFCISTFYVGGVRHPLKAIGISVIVTGFVAYLFSGLMYIPFPLGKFFFADFHDWLFTMLRM